MHPVDAALDVVRVGARGAEDRAAARQDPADGVQVQRHGVALEHAPPAVAEPDELVAVLADALADDGPDDGVEARAVAAAGQDADAHEVPPGRTSGSGDVGRRHDAAGSDARGRTGRDRRHRSHRSARAPGRRRGWPRRATSRCGSSSATPPGRRSCRAPRWSPTPAATATRPGCTAALAGVRHPLPGVGGRGRGPAAAALRRRRRRRGRRACSGSSTRRSSSASPDAVFTLGPAARRDRGARSGQTGVRAHLPAAQHVRRLRAVLRHRRGRRGR